MKKIFSILLVSLSLTSFAQNKLSIGPVYQYGFSSLWGKSDMDMSSGQSTSEFSFKSSFGTGMKIEHLLRKKWSWNAFLLWQQRGAKFDETTCDCPPHYRLNYADLWTGAKYNLNVEKKISFYINAGFTSSLTLNAFRVNSYESVFITDDIKQFDFGTFSALGFDIGLWDKDILQLSLFYSGGFRNVFSGVLEMNSVYGKNMYGGIQFNYLIGISKNTTK